MLDYAFHIGIIVGLSMGISHGFYLKNNVKPSTATVSATQGGNASSINAGNTPILRVVDCSIKHRVLLQADIEGRSVVYRRVKNVNELVVDGNVYAEYKAVMEFPHTLFAKIDGKLISAGYDDFNSYISVDGNYVVRKPRLI